MTRKAPPDRDPEPETVSFTLSDADITSRRAVPHPRLSGVLGAGAAAQAFGNAGKASPSDHDGQSAAARSVGRATPGSAPDGDG
jgi:hypothetical protein